ncbi:hypothetical protein NEF87_004281 [Candidatus Lokiarchaeum ossiferum]|uniref:Transposase IS4-like domain-containing protein n=1 Tax=Candidatus Lokiarchaeum ossiferum TaxID=2951803 RepID=A0ABY6HWT7_9ARCH|nr:hypothetical protein NEF87_004281 [Candidatus Lokiarchaeum sp. B-35]
MKYSGFTPQIFLDGRQSRAFPHQTTINDWLRDQTLVSVEKIYKLVFEKMIHLIFLAEARKTNFVLEFDLTYLGYWGRRWDPLIKGSKMVKGTRRICHYHGAMIHGSKKSLFIGCHYVAKGESKIPFMLQITDWLLELGLNIKVCVVDREYYRHNVLKSFKICNVDVITPAKDYSQLKNCKRHYLDQKKGRTQQYEIGTKAKKGV